MVADAVKVPTESSGRTLRREVGLIGLLFAAEGSIIGSGWLFGAKKALVAAGPSAVLAWTIGAVAIIILALVHAELGGMFPVAGGSARFPHYAFGGVAGASFGWFAWLQAATVAPIEVEAMIGYAQHWSFAASWMKTDGTLTFPTGYIVAVALMAVFVAVNFLGVRALAATNSAVTWWKIGVPLAAIFIVGLTHFHGGNFTAANGFMPSGLHGVFSAVSGSGIIFALLGFEQAIQLAGESKNPKKDLPRATIYSILIGAAIYLLLQVVFIAALPAANIPKLWADLTFPGIAGPWAGLSTLIGLGWLATVLYLDAVLSPSGTGLIYTTATSRISVGLSRNGYVPAAYEKLDGRGVPWVGLITSFIAGIIVFLPFPSWGTLVGFISSASVLMYAGAPLAFGVFRAKLPGWERPYKLGGGVVFAPLAFTVANLIIFWSGWDTDWRLGAAILIGYLILAANQMFAWNPVKPALDFKAAQWLLPYLIGMGVIVWISDFGPGHSFAFSNPVINSWWLDIIVVTAFSLAIYYWALATSLPTEKIEASIGEVAVEEVPSH
jgi:amino acid transporter